MQMALAWDVGVFGPYAPIHVRAVNTIVKRQAVDDDSVAVFDAGSTQINNNFHCEHSSHRCDCGYPG